MKTISTLVTLFVLCLASYAQTSQSVNFQSDYNRFIENQKTPFLKGDAEVFVLDGTPWERLYGESEYVLTPVMENIREYNARIRQLNNASKGIRKSNFHHIKVEVTPISKTLLETMNITIPDYIQGSVNVYLPEIDIDVLSQNAISFSYRTVNTNSYKTQPNETQSPATLLWSENFESGNFPATGYSTSIGTSNCGWDDIGSCYAHAGAWSLWCADLGAACNPNCLDDYVNDMDADFWKSNSINTNGYKDLWFKFWLDFDFYNIGSNDELFRYYDLGSGWVLSSSSYTSAHPDDGQLWIQRTFFYSGSYSSYDFDFEFYSNGIGTSYGVYIDDMELTGTQNVGMQEMSSITNMAVYPNPANGQFTLELSSNTSTDAELHVLNMVGQIVYNETLSSIYGNFQKKLDLSDFSKGIYTIKLQTNDGILNRKIIIE